MKIQFCCLLLIFCLSCSNDKIDLSEYYYPIKANDEGQVYIYSSEDKTLEDEVWFYKSVNIESVDYLLSTIYNADLSINQFITERLVPSGAITEACKLYSMPKEDGSQTEYEIEINHANAFPFFVEDSTGVFLYQISWYDEAEEVQYTVTKNRRFLGFKEKDVLGEMEKCAVFELKEQVESDSKSNGLLELPVWHGEEYYAAGFGLVYFKKDFDETNGREFYLKEVLSMEDFVARTDKRLELH